MLHGVVLTSFGSVLHRMGVMAMRDVSVVGCLLVIASLMMLCGFPMMSSRVLMMLCRLLVMGRALVR